MKEQFMNFVEGIKQKRDEKKIKESEDLMKKRLDEGREKGAKYLVLIWDSADMEETYSFVNSDEELETLKQRFSKAVYGNISKVLEISKEQDPPSAQP